MGGPANPPDRGVKSRTVSPGGQYAEGFGDTFSNFHDNLKFARPYDRTV
jgi:hypothetical protein